jgi:hypothetical protein
MELQDKIDIITSTVVVEEETENSIPNTSDAFSSSYSTSSSFTAVSGDSGERDQNSAALESSCISCNKLLLSPLLLLLLKTVISTLQLLLKRLLPPLSIFRQAVMK